MSQNPSDYYKTYDVEVVDDDRGKSEPKPPKQKSNNSMSVKQTPWQFLIRGLAISGLVFFFLSNLPLLIKAGIYFLAVAFLNKNEDRKPQRIGWTLGVGILIVLLSKLLGRLPFIGEALETLPDLAWLWIPLVYHLAVNAKDGSLNKGREDRPFSLAEFSITCACVVVIVVLLVVSMLNAKPWIELSQTIVNTLMSGNAIQWVIMNSPLAGVIRFAAFFIGVCLWAFCQIIQILPIVLENDPVLGSKLKKAAKNNEFIKGALSNLGLIRTLAYVFEIFVCFASMPPYANGWQGIRRDFPNFDPERIDWVTLLLIIPLTVMGMELIFKTALSLFALRKAALQPYREKEA